MPRLGIGIKLLDTLIGLVFRQILFLPPPLLFHFRSDAIACDGGQQEDDDDEQDEEAEAEGDAQPEDPLVGD